MAQWHSRRESGAGGSLLPGEHGGWGCPGGRPHPLLSLSTEGASDTVPLQRSQSLPHSVTVTMGGTSDPSALSSSALSEREASRLDKFKQLLAGPNTDLGESLLAEGMCAHASSCGLLCQRVICLCCPASESQR